MVPLGVGIAIPKNLLTFYSVLMASYLEAWFPASQCVYSVFQGTLPLSVLLCDVLLLINVHAPLKNLGVEKATEMQSLMVPADPRYSHSKVIREQYDLTCFWADASSSLACIWYVSTLFLAYTQCRS